MRYLHDYFFSLPGAMANARFYATKDGRRRRVRLVDHPAGSKRKVWHVTPGRPR